MSTSSRRTFLAASTAFSLGRVLGANDKVNIGIVGTGGRGNDHIKAYATLPDARIVALCDVNQAALETSQAAVKTLTGEQPTGYDDMRKLFADKNVDAVSITTPNHWHALSTIWACQAGKDVYCEKPACYNVYEGERMIEVARKTGRMVQIGSQSRSLAYKRKAIQLLNEGVIGKVYMAKALCFKRRKSIGHAENGPVPAGVNWDMFLGPAPLRPFNPLRFKYNWHWFWDTGNGDIGNQGLNPGDDVHEPHSFDEGLPAGPPQQWRARAGLAQCVWRREPDGGHQARVDRWCNRQGNDSVQQAGLCHAYLE